MSIKTTPFLHLPQWSAEEKPSFLAEINQGYASIDAGVRANQVAAEAAQTAAEAAKNQADEAVEQGHTNAAGLVTLEQRLTQLEADLATGKQLKAVSLSPAETSSGITWRDGFTNYNNYTGAIFIAFDMAIGTYSSSQGEIKIGTVTGFPYTFNNIVAVTSLSSRESSGNISGNYSARLYSNGTFTLLSANDITIETNEILQFNVTIPAFSGTSVKQQNQQCIFLN